MNPAAASRKAKEKHPENYCTNPKCLWRVAKRSGYSPCPKHMTLKDLGYREVKWTFDDDENTFDGFTDDSRWNGWLNVWVTPETHAKVVAKYGAEPESDFADLTPIDDGPMTGMFCYGWCYCAQEVTE